MNEALSRLAQELRLQQPENRPLCLAFGLACAERVQHLLEDPRALECLAFLRDCVQAGCDEGVLSATANEATQIASSHRGSNSIDGSAHAAVSATYAVANALAGRALEAASYAAYAAVYAYGGYAITDPASFEPEFAWQRQQLQRLAGASMAHSASARSSA
jgi:hypothetical protein